jgi:hypothetical protein
MLLARPVAVQESLSLRRSCRTCNCTWRSTETPDKTDTKLYNKKFKIKASEIDKMLVIPPVSPLKP